MTEATSRLALPFIVPGQAQKEFYHNEALARIDVALHASVEGAALASAPENPTEGQCWIVGSGATGAWSGEEGSIAGWTAGGWRFIYPVAGMSVWNKSAGYRISWLGSEWSGGEIRAAEIRIAGKKVVGERQPAVASPSGGTVIDAEARAVIVALTATLKSHGLIERCLRPQV